MKPRALVLHAAGINRDADAVYALQLAGADARVVHVNELRANRKMLFEFQLLVVPGGFSYADALGAGKLFALDIASFFKNEIAAFVESGRPVIGICNGFQALVKAGILPGLRTTEGTVFEEERCATLTGNLNGRFECRWVTLKAQASPCVWTKGLDELVTCPVAHGEGRFLVRDEEYLNALQEANLIAFIYSTVDGFPARGGYPDNPNGSVRDIAGLCNPKGNVLGLMPHPEDNVFSGPGSRAYRNGRPGAGLSVFVNGVRYATQI